MERPSAFTMAAAEKEKTKIIYSVTHYLLPINYTEILPNKTGKKVKKNTSALQLREREREREKERERERLELGEYTTLDKLSVAVQASLRRLRPCLNSSILPLDLSPNPRFCAFPRRGKVSQYLREQGGVLFIP